MRDFHEVDAPIQAEGGTHLPGGKSAASPARRRCRRRCPSRCRRRATSSPARREVERKRAFERRRRGRRRARGLQRLPAGDCGLCSARHDNTPPRVPNMGHQPKHEPRQRDRVDPPAVLVQPRRRRLEHATAGRPAPGGSPSRPARRGSGRTASLAASATVVRHVDPNRSLERTLVSAGCRPSPARVEHKAGSSSPVVLVLRRADASHAECDKPNNLGWSTHALAGSVLTRNGPFDPSRSPAGAAASAPVPEEETQTGGSASPSPKA
jgi:hypothetical protein